MQNARDQAQAQARLDSMKVTCNFTFGCVHLSFVGLLKVQIQEGPSCQSFGCFWMRFAKIRI